MIGIAFPCLSPRLPRFALGLLRLANRPVTLEFMHKPGVNAAGVTHEPGPCCSSGRMPVCVMGRQRGGRKQTSAGNDPGKHLRNTEKGIISLTVQMFKLAYCPRNGHGSLERLGW